MDVMDLLLQAKKIPLWIRKSGISRYEFRFDGGLPLPRCSQDGLREPLCRCRLARNDLDNK